VHHLGATITRVALDLLESLFEVLDELERDGVEHALVGGLALAVHGAARATTDIDLLVQDAQLARAVAAVKRAGFPFEALPMTFRDGMRLQRVSRIEDGETLTVDLIVADDNLAPIWSSRARYEFERGRALWVVSREALIAMKLQAGRPQDLADVERLIEADR
jgi:Nucleotidyl transferase AbiEii toxin, Type IV TA system